MTSPFLKEFRSLKKQIKQKGNILPTLRESSKLREKHGMLALEEKMRGLDRKKDNYAEEYESLFLKWKEAYSRYQVNIIAFMKSELERLQ